MRSIIFFISVILLLIPVEPALLGTFSYSFHDSDNSEIVELGIEYE
ncbi:hypothetical protein Mpsy_0645 [Methanolobus psychrophilus R15]|nr:hypothetical protein Mpsy_0645 [Methanolobus psychrophilus R15]